ncbi:hypothetical protein J6590_051962 [Homalodisca vitripennis]|nr:hypothetical protein J6590_051962 [Homalodisca vitripennis]
MSNEGPWRRQWQIRVNGVTFSPDCTCWYFQPNKITAVYEYRVCQNIRESHSTCNVLYFSYSLFPNYICHRIRKDGLYPRVYLDLLNTTGSCTVVNRIATVCLRNCRPIKYVLS